jgi:predicted acylesterase/phospholipase RssA
MQYDLVFEGGGAKGAVFVGAIQEFERRGHTARRFVGTSAGAITATLMAAGYTSVKMLAVTKEKTADGKPRFSTFMDIAEEFSAADIDNSLAREIFNRVDLPLVPTWVEQQVDRALLSQFMSMSVYRELFSFVERGGLYAGDAFLSWIREKLDMGAYKLSTATFADFRQKTDSDLSLVASDTTGHQMLVLNHRTAPKCPVAWGVRMSMSIPFIWQEVRWNPSWGTYQGKTLDGHTIVDGGVLSNFPLRLLTSHEPDVVDVMGDTDPDGAPNLGLLIDETLAVPNAGQPATPKADDSLKADLLQHTKRLRTIQRITRLVDTMTSSFDQHIIDAHGNEVCRLPAGGYGTTEFDMSEQRMTALIEAGRVAMNAFLDKT